MKAEWEFRDGALRGGAWIPSVWTLDLGSFAVEVAVCDVTQRGEPRWQASLVVRRAGVLESPIDIGSKWTDVEKCKQLSVKHARDEIRGLLKGARVAHDALSRLATKTGAA